MQLKPKRFFLRSKMLIHKIFEDNIFLLSSSMAYYSALAVGPFILILLGSAAFMGQNIQTHLMDRANMFSPEMGLMVKLVFSNINSKVNWGRFSGVFGVIALFLTSSMVFLQLRYSFDVIYGTRHLKLKLTLWQKLKERLFAMQVVLMAGLFFTFTVILNSLFKYSLGSIYSKSLIYKSALYSVNFLIFVFLFTGIHYFIPSVKPRFKSAIKIAIFTAIFFILGNYMFAYYFKKFALKSIYGAAGSFFVFLVWSYYSSFVIFLSSEIYLYLRKLAKMERNQSIK